MTSWFKIWFWAKFYKKLIFRRNKIVSFRIGSTTFSTTAFIMMTLSTNNKTCHTQHDNKKCNTQPNFMQQHSILLSEQLSPSCWMLFCWMSWRQRKSTVKDKEARGHINLSIEMFNLNKKKKRVFFHFISRWGGGGEGKRKARVS